MVDHKVRQHRMKYVLWRQFPQHNRDWLNYFVVMQDTQFLTAEQYPVYNEVQFILEAMKKAADEGLLRLYIEVRRQEYTPLEAENVGSMMPVYDLWAKMAFWTIDEGIDLLQGCNPRQVSHDKILPLLDHPFAARYCDLYEVASRAVVAQQLKLRNHPSYFLAWAGRMDIPYPPELELAITLLGDQIADWKTAYDNLSEAYKAVNAAIDEWKSRCNDLSAMNSDTVNQAQKIISERDDLIQILLEEIEVAREIALPAPEPEYISPYMEYMRQAIIENEITPDNQSKKEVLKSWFLENAPEGLPMSNNKADMMATLIRMPEAEIGGNKKPRNPSTLAESECLGYVEEFLTNV